VRERLELIRQTIRKVVPEAQEKISYSTPTFKLDRNVIHYAAFKNHIGLYTGSAAIEAFKKDLLSYRTSKGTIQLPADAAIPCSLIERIARVPGRPKERNESEENEKNRGQQAKTD
jgi:uncharacterized protein YdhG (YjbR/CyaY superfamily)